MGTENQRRSYMAILYKNNIYNDNICISDIWDHKQLAKLNSVMSVSEELQQTS